MQSLRGERDPVQIDLRELIDKGANAHSAHGTREHAIGGHHDARHVHGDALGRRRLGRERREANIYVVGNTGKDTEDALYKMNR